MKNIWNLSFMNYYVHKGSSFKIIIKWHTFLYWAVLDIGGSSCWCWRTSGEDPESNPLSMVVGENMIISHGSVDSKWWLVFGDLNDELENRESGSVWLARVFHVGRRSSSQDLPRLGGALTSVWPPPKFLEVASCDSHDGRHRTDRPTDGRQLTDLPLVPLCCSIPGPETVGTYTDAGLWQPRFWEPTPKHTCQNGPKK